MVRHCFVPGCKTRGGGFKFFSVPYTTRDRWEAWLVACPFLKRYSQAQLENVRICILHFDSQSMNDKLKLNRDAIPKLNLPTPSSDIQMHSNSQFYLSVNPIQCGKDLKISLTRTLSFDSEVTLVDQNHDHSYSKEGEEISESKTTEESNTTVPELRLTSDISKSMEAECITPDVIGDCNIDQDSQTSTVSGFDEPPTEAIFSWQKEDILYPAEDTDVLMCPEPAKGDNLRQLLEEASLYDDQPTQPSQHEKTQKRADAGYQCNICEKEIIGFRYTCVQCADFDLCRACEANGAHAAHYVLRVPKDRPYNEIQTVLAAIRQQLLAENLFLTEQIIEDSVKSESEDGPENRAEEGGEHPPEQVPAEPDPLRRPTPGLARRASPLTIRSDDEYSDGSVYRPPRRKRWRRRSNTNSDSDTDSSDTTHTETPRHHKARTKPATCSALIHPVHGNQIVTNPKDYQPAVFKVTGAVYQLPDDIFSVPGTVFEVPGNIYEVPAAMAANGVLEVPDNITVFRQEPSPVISERIFVEEDVVQSNLEEDSGILHLRVPTDTDDAALAQALHSQAYVVMKPLVIRTMKR